MADYYSVISSAVSNLPSKAVEARWEVYDRACSALQEELLALDPPLSGDQLANEQLALETAIRRVEEDLLLATMRRFVRDDAPRPVRVIVLSAVRGFVSSMEDRLHDAITIVRERLRSSAATKVVVPIKEDIIARLTQNLVFLEKTQLRTKKIGRRIYMSIFSGWEP
jgi:hypothetical protein